MSAVLMDRRKPEAEGLMGHVGSYSESVNRVWRIAHGWIGAVFGESAGAELWKANVGRMGQGPG